MDQACQSAIAPTCGDGDGLIAARLALGENQVLAIVAVDHSGHDARVASGRVDAIPDGAQCLAVLIDCHLE